MLVQYFFAVLVGSFYRLHEIWISVTMQEYNSTLQVAACAFTF